MRFVLSARQADALAAIRVVTQREGRPPLLKEIAYEIGVSKERARRLVLSLERKGAVVRGIRAVDSATLDVLAESK